MARLSRHELKEDRVRTAFEDYEAFAKQHGREIVTVVVLGLAIGGAVFGLRRVIRQAEANANTKLAAALKTYHAYVGAPSPDVASAGVTSFATEQEKYKKALAEFQAVNDVTGIEKLLPRLKAMRVAQYYAALCQAELGQHDAAEKALQDSSHDSDEAIASLAKFALAGEYAKTGKTQDAIKIYQNLSEHPSSTVSRSTAMLALAGVYRATKPAQARQIYERLEKEYASDTALADTLKQQASTLPQ